MTKYFKGFLNYLPIPKVVEEVTYLRIKLALIGVIGFAELKVRS